MCVVAELDWQVVLERCKDVVHELHSQTSGSSDSAPTTLGFAFQSVRRNTDTDAYDMI